MLLALFEPDIAQNTGSFIRLSACLGTKLHIIEPCGFPLDDKRMRRVALDYYDLASITRHISWAAFKDYSDAHGKRMVLLTTQGAVPYHHFTFTKEDILLCGRESAGVPEHVHAHAHARICIPMQPGARSLNVAMAAGMVLGEALRQTGGFTVSYGN